MGRDGNDDRVVGRATTTDGVFDVPLDVVPWLLEASADDVAMAGIAGWELPMTDLSGPGRPMASDPTLRSIRTYLSDPVVRSRGVTGHVRIDPDRARGWIAAKRTDLDLGDVARFLQGDDVVLRTRPGDERMVWDASTDDAEPPHVVFEVTRTEASAFLAELDRSRRERPTPGDALGTYQAWSGCSVVDGTDAPTHMAKALRVGFVMLEARFGDGSVLGVTLDQDELADLVAGPTVGPDVTAPTVPPGP